MDACEPRGSVLLTLSSITLTATSVPGRRQHVVLPRPPVYTEAFKHGETPEVEALTVSEETLKAED